MSNIKLQELIGDTLENLKNFISEKKERGIDLSEFENYLNGEFNKFTLILGGSQISRSLSPFIHNYGNFLAYSPLSRGTEGGVETHCNASLPKTKDYVLSTNFYLLLDLEKYGTTTKEALDEIEKNENYLGANVTMPYKEEVFEILKSQGRLESEAVQAGAVNTIFKKEGKVWGTNTDIFGIQEPIKNLKTKDYPLRTKSAYLLGAGGAARGAIVALKNLGVEEIKIFNRSIENAKKLKEDFENEKLKIEIIEYDLLNSEKNEIKNHFNKKGILINTLPFGFKENLPKLVVQENEFKNIFQNIETYFDIVYDLTKGETPTIKKAKEIYPEIKICEGVDMLISQAKGGFEKWFGKELDTKKIKKIIKS